MEARIEEPQAGGSYLRNADGTLTLAQRTAPAAEPPTTPPAPLQQPAAPAQAEE